MLAGGCTAPPTEGERYERTCYLIASDFDDELVRQPSGMLDVIQTILEVFDRSAMRGHDLGMRRFDQARRLQVDRL